MNVHWVAEPVRKLGGKSVYVKLSLSVNCENFGESFFFPFFFGPFYFLSWNRPGVAWGFVYILSARLNISVGSKWNLWRFWFRTDFFFFSPEEVCGVGLTSGVSV